MEDGVKMISVRGVLFVAFIGIVLLSSVPCSASDGSISENYIYVGHFGESGSAAGQFNKPLGIAVDLTGNIYVADTHNHRIQMFDSFGSFIREWGGKGTAEGKFDTPIGIAVDESGNIYVADSENHRISIFGNSGSHLKTIGGRGAGEGLFLNPAGVAVDASYLYVADTHNNRIQIFRRDGSFISTFGGSGTGDGQFRYPTGIAVDSFGSLFVMDGVNNRIQKMSASGTFIKKWNTGGYGLSVDDGDQLFLADYTTQRIKKWGSDETLLSLFGADHLRTPYDVAIRRVGETGKTPYVYVIDAGHNKVAIYAPEGSIIPPIANFTQKQIDATNSAPLTIQFNYTVQAEVGRTPDSFSWEFGDGQTSSEQNPIYTYKKPGLYTVSLTVQNDEGRDTKRKTDLILVTEPPELYFIPDATIMVPDREQTFSLYMRTPPGQKPDDLSGYNLTIELNGPFYKTATIVDVTFPTWAQFTAVSDIPAESVWCRAIDADGGSGNQHIHLLDLTILTQRAGNVLLTLDDTGSKTGVKFDVEDREGNLYRPTVIPSDIRIENLLPFKNPSGGYFQNQQSLPPASSGLFNDLDGNGRLGFNDVVIYYTYLQAIKDGDYGRIMYYDYDGNGWIGYYDVVTLNGWVG
jgi:PKD repeat protein